MEGRVRPECMSEEQFAEALRLYEVMQGGTWRRAVTPGVLVGDQAGPRAVGANGVSSARSGLRMGAQALEAAVQGRRKKGGHRQPYSLRALPARREVCELAPAAHHELAWSAGRAAVIRLLPALSSGTRRSIWSSWPKPAGRKTRRLANSGSTSGSGRAAQRTADPRRAVNASGSIT